MIIFKKLFRPTPSELSILEREDVQITTLQNILMDTNLFELLNVNLLNTTQVFHLEMKLHPAVYGQVHAFPDAILRRVLNPSKLPLEIRRHKDVLIVDKTDPAAKLARWYERVRPYEHLLRLLCFVSMVGMVSCGVVAAICLGAYVLWFSETELLLGGTTELVINVATVCLAIMGTACVAGMYIFVRSMRKRYGRVNENALLIDKPASTPADDSMI